MADDDQTTPPNPDEQSGDEDNGQQDETNWERLSTVVKEGVKQCLTDLGFQPRSESGDEQKPPSRQEKPRRRGFLEDFFGTPKDE